jgi:putative transcriptional regulator
MGNMHVTESKNINKTPNKNKIKVYRAIKDITQEQLANAVGVSRMSISSYEQGIAEPSVFVALKMAEYFNTTINDLFYFKK